MPRNTFECIVQNLHLCGKEQPKFSKLLRVIKKSKKSLPYLSQESMVLSRRQLAYLFYLEVFLTVLQNYTITAFANLRLTPLKCQKMKQQQQNR